MALLALSLGCVGCVGSAEADAWAEEEERPTAPVEWEGSEGERRERRDRRVSAQSGSQVGEPGFAQPSGAGRRRVAIGEGPGWRVSATGGQPVETFASAEGPVGFAPRDPRDPPPERQPAADQPGPWLTVPSQAPGTSAEDAAKPKRTTLGVRAEGVDLVPEGHCGHVPVARYGLDWRPAREWRLGQDADAEPWLRPVPPLPLPPLPKPGEIQETEVPVGSWIEAR